LLSDPHEIINGGNKNRKSAAVSFNMLSICCRES
jgi:hypothetical protein